MTKRTEIEITNEKSGFCGKCKLRVGCDQMCRPVEQALFRAELSPLMEVSYNDREVVCYPQKRQVRFSEMDHFNPDRIVDPGILEEAAEREIPAKPERNRAAVFYKRFFQQKEYQDIADECHITVETARSHYAQAKEWIERIMGYLDRQRFAMNASVEYQNRLEPAQVWFLMARAWGLSIPDIQRLWLKKYGTDYIHKKIMDVGNGDFISTLERREAAMESLGEYKNRMPKENVWFLMARAWGLKVPEIRKIWPKKYSENYISRKISETAKDSLCLTK